MPNVCKKCLENCTVTLTHDIENVQKVKCTKNVTSEIYFFSIVIPSFALFSFSLWFWLQDVFQGTVYSGCTHLKTLVLLPACFSCLDLFFFFPKHFFHCNWLHMREKFAFMFHKNVLLIHNCTCHLIQIWAVALLITRTQ